ncbi:hypothetical protein SYNPS1DRAFT_26689, partial [Syncephalis pseudoplumigaleata]
MTETPPVNRRSGRSRVGRGGRRGAAAQPPAVATEPPLPVHEPKQQPEPHEQQPPPLQEATTPAAPPPAAMMADARRKAAGRRRVLATTATVTATATATNNNNNDSTISSTQSTPRRQSANRRRRTSRRFEEITSSSEEEPELDLPDDHEPPRPDEAPLPTATSFSRRIWQVIANSPQWIREQGRGSDSETDSDTEVLRKLYQRRRVSGPYWLRPDVHAPNRLTYAEHERNRRRRRRLGVLHNGEDYPYMSGSEYDDSDDMGDEDDDRNDGDYRDDDGDEEDGGGVNIKRDPDDDWDARPLGMLDEYPPPSEMVAQFAHLPGVDELPPDADIEDLRRLLPKPPLWRRLRKGFRVYVRKPGLRLLKWVALRLLFAIFAVYWIAKEAVLFLARVSWRVLSSYVWKPLTA